MRNNSPKLQYLSHILLHAVVEKKKRLLVFAEWPMVQWKVEMFLLNLGFIVLCLRSKHSDEEKTLIYQALQSCFSDKAILHMVL